MEKFSLKLDGLDCTAAIYRWGVSYQPVKVEGPASGVSQGGTVIVDLIRTKDSWTLKGNAVREDFFKQLSVICRKAYATAIYLHPETGQSVTKTVLPTLSAANRKIMHGVVWYDGWTLSLEER